MGEQGKKPERDLGRSQLIFVLVGLMIVAGGLWLLYQGEGPYHPPIPASEYEGGEVWQGS